MAFSLIDLPYAEDALDPVISRDTVVTHYGKHHSRYVTKANSLLEDNHDLAGATLTQVVRKAHAVGDLSLFNNASQIWNHNFYWMSLCPQPVPPSGILAEMIAHYFGGVEQLGVALVEEAADHFSNGWVWLLRDGDELVVRSYHDADTPLVHEGICPLLTIDIWEHAYYIDYRHAREDYATAVLSGALNWSFAARNLDGDGAERADQQAE